MGKKWYKGYTNHICKIEDENFFILKDLTFAIMLTDCSSV